MKHLVRIVLLLLVLGTALGGLCFAADGETLYTDAYCFSEADFEAPQLSTLNGIFVTAVPAPEVAQIRLGSRVLRAGDVLPVDELACLRLLPACAENCDAVLRYQPICGHALGEEVALTVRIQSGKNERPTAENYELETYRNIANDGRLSGANPERASLTFQLVDAPKRGTVELNLDGTFVYTPAKNKVGEDSFTFTVTDEAGNVSAPATVRISILKPGEDMTYADVLSTDAFEAAWMLEQGLDGGRSIGGVTCFCPEDTVSRADFLVMLMKLAGIQPDESAVTGFSDTARLPEWQRQYLAAAFRRALVRGERGEDALCFRPNDAVTPQEAAVMVQSVLQLPVSAASLSDTLPVWSADSVQALHEAGVSLRTDDAPLLRVEAAKLLYQVRQLMG